MKKNSLGVLVAGLALVTAVGLAGCAPAPDADAERPLMLAVSLPPVATIVQRVAGEGIEVFSLIGSGDSPATFQPSDAQVTRLARASHYFRAGVPFENGSWSSAVQSLKSIEVVDLTQGLELRSLQGHVHGAEGGEHDSGAASPATERATRPEAAPDGHQHHDSSGHDPHFWLAPEFMKRIGETVSTALCSAQPDACSGFEERLAELHADLESLDGEIRFLLADCAGLEFFVFHPSWGYFADTYGLKQVAVEAGGQTASDSELTRLARRAESGGARVLFVQPQIGGTAAAAAAVALGLEVEILDPMEADIFTNLRDAAERIAESCGRSEGE